MKKLTYVILLSAILLLPSFRQQTVFLTKNGTISFTSDAPLELIEAKSEKLAGAINIENRTFSFKIPMTSFQGFNSSLQRTHFNENYMESDKYPTATFKGKIIEDIDFKEYGTYKIRAKGKLKIHGITQTRIIRSKLVIMRGQMIIQSEFTVPLSDHNIRVPKVVTQKIADEIYVRVSGKLNPN